MRLTILLTAALVLSGCDVNYLTQTEIEVAIKACTDGGGHVLEVRSNLVRCTRRDVPSCSSDPLTCSVGDAK
jgi:hypothetical protein